MKQTLIAFIATLLIFVALTMTEQSDIVARSESVFVLMETANQAYDEADYALASRSYQQLVDQGVVDVALFYNLGNSYYKLGDWGRAIVNYRRALVVAPRDGDIQTNLALARAETVDALDQESELISIRIASAGAMWLTFNETARLALGVWLVFGVTMFAYSQLTIRRWREVLQLLLVGLITLVIGLSGLLVVHYYVQENYPAAVIVVDEPVDIRSGPGTQFVTEFTLHSGAEVTWLEQRGPWTRIALPGGNLQGWLDANDVERVVEFRQE